jgi:hypothetical protein
MALKAKTLTATGAARERLKAKEKKRKTRRYEMILQWATVRQPFVSQKLGFDGSLNFHKAYAEAVDLKNLLKRAGAFKKGDVRIIGFAVDGALTKWQQEHTIWIVAKAKEQAKYVKAILAAANKNNKIKPVPSKSKINLKKPIRVR